jgi:hypothetical protein
MIFDEFTDETCETIRPERSLHGRIGLGQNLDQPSAIGLRIDAQPQRCRESLIGGDLSGDGASPLEHVRLKELLQVREFHSGGPHRGSCGGVARDLQLRHQFRERRNIPVALDHGRDRAQPRRRVAI